MVISGFIILFLAIHYSIFLVRILTGLFKLEKCDTENLPDEFVTILIPFRNESGKILKSLASIENQDYPKNKFEVIYINDNSDDDSPVKLDSAEKSANIRMINAVANGGLRGHKKEAIRQGITEAKGGIIVSTDSDCAHKPGWLRKMLNCFDEETAFVSGPVEFVKGKSIFSNLQRLEFSGLIFTGAGLIGSGTPIICNAANLAYRKKVFCEVGGFADNEHLSSGDDEFLMQKIAKTEKYKIKFCAEPEAVAFTDPNEGVDQFFNQRKRWASKGLHYQDKVLIFRLVLIFFFYLSLVIQPVLGFFVSDFYFRTFLISIILKLVFEFLIIFTGSKLMNMKGLIGLFPLAEILQVPYIIYSAVSGLFGNYHWRGRKLER